MRFSFCRLRKNKKAVLTHKDDLRRGSTLFCGLLRLISALAPRRGSRNSGGISRGGQLFFQPRKSSLCVRINENVSSVCRRAAGTYLFSVKILYRYKMRLSSLFKKKVTAAEHFNRKSLFRARSDIFVRRQSGIFVRRQSAEAYFNGKIPPQSQIT